jgi:uncharacterized membrane protein YphA (DoxX/SURF4 family)
MGQAPVKPFHRRDRTALVIMRLVMGTLVFEGGVELLRNSWGATGFIKRLNHGLNQSTLAPEFADLLARLSSFDSLAAQAVLLVHLIGGILLILGVLTRSTALLIGLMYLAYALVYPMPLPILVCVSCAGLALSDAGQHFTIQGVSFSTRPIHQSTKTG